MMFKLLLLLKCVLVKSNIVLYQPCPLTYQPNYQELPPVISPIYPNPYQQQFLVQNHETSALTSHLSEQVKKLLLETVLSSSTVNSLIGNNVPSLEQYGDLSRFTRNPSDSDAKVVNNYIIVPPEYVEINSNDKRCQCRATNDKIQQNDKYLGDINQNTNTRRKYTERSTKTNNNKATNEKLNDKNSRNKITNHEDSLRNSKDRKKLKPTTIKDEKVMQSNKKSSKPANVDSDRDDRQRGIKLNNHDSNFKNSKIDNKKSDNKSKNTHKHKDSDNLNLSYKPEHSKKNSDVHFDINEDCTGLDCRRTRNDNNDKPNKDITQKFPKEFSDNIISYMNYIMSNPQYNPNFLNPSGNFPYNFDYIYQLPQQFNTKLHGSGNQQKNRKKNHKSDNNTKQNKNNEEQREVELTPQFIEIEEDTKPTSGVNSKITDRQRTNYGSNKFPAIGEEDSIPFHYDNDILDDYYPDFTSDNFYLSKEDFELNNNNDRYYYNTDNKSEMSRNKRKYERTGKNLNEHNQYRKPGEILNRQHKFRTPPALEFPDFKTIMIDKDKHIDPGNYININKQNERTSYSDLMFKKDFDNGVQTVFAHSKVVKYGPPMKEERLPLFTSRELNKNDDQILISRDGDKTIVIAKSLGHPDDY